MKLAIVTDAWHPQINGVVTTLSHVVARAKERGDTVDIIEPSRFNTVPCPKYENDIQLATNPWKVVSMLKASAPDAIHIVTEGPIGMAARFWLAYQSIPFTSAYHTKFPEYFNTQFPILSVDFGYRVLRKFHAASQSVFVATQSVKQELESRGFQRLALWSRGVDAERFHPNKKAIGERIFGDHPKPWFTYVGRVATEKNIDAFLELTLPGTKFIVGDGPLLGQLKQRYPEVVFVGFQTGDALAGCYAASDVFVFPSRSDTFGVVQLEAMASGCPIAAFPVAGPKDVIINGETGVLSENLEQAATQCLELDPAACRQYAAEFSWANTADQLLDNLAIIPKHQRLSNAAITPLKKAKLWLRLQAD